MAFKVAEHSFRARFNCRWSQPPTTHLKGIVSVQILIYIL